MTYCLPSAVYGFCRKNKQKTGRLALLTVCIFFTSFLFAQTMVTGIVTTGDSLARGATVQVKGKNIATQTDSTGHFSITAQIGDVLVASYIGYDALETTVTSTSGL